MGCPASGAYTSWGPHLVVMGDPAGGVMSSPAGVGARPCSKGSPADECLGLTSWRAQVVDNLLHGILAGGYLGPAYQGSQMVGS